MRKAIWVISALLLVSGLTWAQPRTPSSLGEIARKVRAQRAKKDLSKVPFFTNENLPKAGAAVSILGRTAPPPEAAEGAAAESEAGAAEEENGEECSEQCWREKFRAQREKVRTAERELDLLQREYNLTRQQYYQDPNQAMREQYSGNVAGGRELMDLLQRINEKRQEIQGYQQELSNLENELRRARGDPGWARE